MTLVKVAYRQIPERLYHYTRGFAALSIIWGEVGKDEEICFWLKNARSKNDAAELKLGMALVEWLQKYMHQNKRSSIINEVVIDSNMFL